MLPWVSVEKIAVTDHAIYMLANYTKQNNLIEMIDAASPFDDISSFWSPIVPYGEQPLAYNDYVIAINNHNRVALAFVGLPYVFILDTNHKAEQILCLESSLWEEIKQENPSVKPVKYASVKQEGVTFYILHLHLADNGNLYLRTQDAFYTLEEEDGSYRLKGAKRFVTNEKIVPGRSGPVRVPSEAMEVKEDTVYFASGFSEYIYRFSVK